MRNTLIAVVLLFLSAATAQSQSQKPAQPPAAAHAASAQGTAPAAAPPTELQKKIEAYIRDLYAFGKDFTVRVSQPQPTPISDLSAYAVQIGFNGQTDSTVVYVSKDGKFLIRGELDDLSVDPLDAIRKSLHTEGAPSKGPSDARVTLVEYADYECPMCHQLDTLLRTLLPKYPQIRLVYKDFPITDLHPWALSAAEAGHCAFTQNPSAFWKFHDSIFDSQDLISPDNAFDKLLDLASQAGLNSDQMKTCMADPATAQFIHAEQAEAQNLDVNSTPTIFVNGRRIVGPNEQQITQYIDYELAKKP
ncbi:MAG: thioredoxin domain-containing protein [Candidatus Acidiferrales bacterium]